MSIAGRTGSSEDAAKHAAGNWQVWTCFALGSGSVTSTTPGNLGSFSTPHNRDSGLLDQSNADAIARSDGAVHRRRRLGRGDAGVAFHWAVGHVDGFSIRVFRNGEITDAFKAYHDLMEKVDGYPILDEEDYSRREYRLTIENINDAAWRIKHEYELPDGWDSEVYSWLSDNRSGSVENRDDQGGYPQEYDLRAAFDALGYVQVEE